MPIITAKVKSQCLDWLDICHCPEVLKELKGTIGFSKLLKLERNRLLKGTRESAGNHLLPRITMFCVLEEMYSVASEIHLGISKTVNSF